MSFPSQKVPLLINFPSSQIQPSPDCEPSLHSPLQQEFQFQCIQPNPCRKSSINQPLQQLPPPHLYTPCPFLLSLMQSPSQLQFPNDQFPQPQRIPFLNWPLYTAPFFQQYIPSPSGFPFAQSPSYRSPFENISSPRPCLQPFLTSPSYSEAVVCILPSPSGRFNFQVPSQQSVPDSHLPMPCFMPLTKLPIYRSPFCHRKMPLTSSGLLLINFPMQILPAIYYNPYPCLQLFWNSPSQNLPTAMLGLTPWVFLFLANFALLPVWVLRQLVWWVSVSCICQQIMSPYPWNIQLLHMPKYSALLVLWISLIPCTTSCNDQLGHCRMICNLDS